MEKDKELQNLDEYVKLSEFTNVEIGLAAAKTINNALEQVMDKIGEIFSPVTHALLLIDKETEKLYYKLVKGKSADKLANHKIPKGEGLASWVVEKKLPDFIEDAKSDPRSSKNIEKLTDYEIKSIIAVPLEVTDKTIGVFQLINKADEGTYSVDDLNIMKTIVEYASLAIEKVYYLSAMKDLDNVDSLTGIYKRSYFDNQFEKEVARTKRYNNPLSMLIVNVNDLNAINDEHGHEAGDQILKNLAAILKGVVRRVDIVARYSGDEFTILLPQTSKGNAEIVRERIQRDINKGSKKGPVPYSVSIGLGSAGAKAAGSLIDKAEKDLQKQKPTKEEAPKKKR